MLTDQVLEFLTAFVDGELSQRQRKAVMRVLERSSEARDMLRQMQENAHKLKKLPRRKVEPSLAAQVLQAIAEQKAMPKQPTKSKSARRAWMPYLAATLAASLLIGVIGIAYWKAMVEPNDPLKDGSDKFAKVVPEYQPAPKPPVEIPLKKKKHPLLDSMIENTAAAVGTTPPEQVFTAKFDDLRDAKGSTVGRLASELDSARTAVHVDVTVKNNVAALDRLRMVLKEQKIKIVADPGVTKPVTDKKQAKVEYLVFAENVTPDEVAKLMSELGQEFVVSQGMNQKTVQSAYKKLAVKPIGQEDKQQLAKLLGVDPGTMERQDVKPAAKRNSVAVLLPTSSAAAPSAEVRQFVASRQPQPGTLQVLIRIHQD